ncbi:cobalt transporter [Bifidobacterium sp. DSM 109958]|uniref:Cobalt transporter n=1 Tax=Bifidobacterium moraviense TaxID=2675323 RepID=A0A7Y0EZX2_9BIFI|nr:energy-coupling factor transporter transmembrane component T [Bifidobacterium sp. DSM 109958]NMM99475.1 cobalt transporter [Bifidobacterium sp. DSM 109958]
MDADLYVPGDGWLHRADPRVKFLLTAVLLVLCLVWRDPTVILAALTLEHVMLATDHVPPERILWVWKVLAVIIALIVVLWPVFDPSGEHVLWSWGWLRLTRENLVMAAVMGLRIPALGFACFLTLFTTSQARLVRGLTAVGVPYRAGLTLAIALRYIPVFFRIVQSVCDAQRARGLDLGGGSLMARGRAYLPVLVAVLIRAYRMSQSVGWAMASRGLGIRLPHGRRRTSRVTLTMRPADWALLAAIVAVAAALVAERIVLG